MEGRTGMKRVRWMGVLLGVFGAAGLVAPAAGSALTFSVKFQIQRGQYTSHASCLPACEDYGGIHSFSESDEHVQIVTRYEGLKIPRKGRAPSQFVVRGSPDVDPVGNWTLTQTFWTSDNPNTPMNCHGLLFVTSQDPPEIISATGSTARNLKVYVQSGSLFQPRSTSGTNCDPADAHRWHAFYPATFEPIGSDGYLPDMLTAHVSLPLAELRKLHPGDTWGMTFHQGSAERLPPSDCSDFTGTSYTCGQRLDWTGHLSLKRTG